MTLEQYWLNRSTANATGWRRAALLAILSVAGPLARAQNPTITSISPSTVAAGSAAFTLQVTGTNYNAASTVSVGGTTLAPSTETATLLQVTVPANLVAAPAQLAVVVINSGPAPLQSNTVTLTVAKPGAAPVLTSATPGLDVRGASQVQMTLVGSNFRPGATVVVSPPLAALSQSTGTLLATDVQVASVTVINAGLMTARINVSPTAAAGLRAVDVLNADGTNTATGTPFAAGGSSQPVRVQVASSLGAPLSVVNLSLMHPRSGTVVMRNQELYADAILAGSGTGTVIGQWVWDGNVVEQFTASLAGRDEHHDHNTPIAADFAAGPAHAAVANGGTEQLGECADHGGGESGELATGAVAVACLRKRVYCRESAVAQCGLRCLEPRSMRWALPISLI